MNRHLCVCVRGDLAGGRRFEEDAKRKVTHLKLICETHTTTTQTEVFVVLQLVPAGGVPARLCDSPMREPAMKIDPKWAWKLFPSEWILQHTHYRY